MRSIDGFGEWTQIWTQISDKTCRLGSRVGKIDTLKKAGAGGLNPVNKRGSAYSTEALIKILSNLTDEDREMLSQIVERWGDLSEELKRAVLRVVGKG